MYHAISQQQGIAIIIAVIIIVDITANRFAIVVVIICSRFGRKGF